MDYASICVHSTKVFHLLNYTHSCNGAQARLLRQVLPRGVTPCLRSGAVAVLCWSSREEIIHIQGTRNPTKTVGTGRGHQRADRLKLQSQTTGQPDHRTTAMSNSTKQPCRVGPPKTDGHGGEV